MAKKQRRSLFDIFFGKRNPPPAAATQLKLLNAYNPFFAAFGQEAYDSDDVRAAVDAIARNVSKLNPKHIRRDASGNITHVADSIEYLLAKQPNPLMDAYTFYYKVTTLLLLHNNAFIYIQTDDMGNPIGLYPIPFYNIELQEFAGQVYCKFLFMGGDSVTVAYEDMIHLRRFFYRHDIYGEQNIQALGNTLEVLNTINQGLISSVTQTSTLRGILKYKNILKPDDLKARQDAFIKDYLTIENESGVAALDNDADYTQLKLDPKTPDEQMYSYVADRVGKYFGIAPEIITSNYTEAQWNSFYQSTIEPIALQMSLQFTKALFSTRAQQFGNEIVFEASRLEYANAITKTALIKQLMPMGIFSVNEAREIFGLAPIEGGDKHLQTLNVTNLAKADTYQGVDDGTEPGGDGGGAPPDSENAPNNNGMEDDNDETEPAGA